jgi:hypothetical protein
MPYSDLCIVLLVRLSLLVVVVIVGVQRRVGAGLAMQTAVLLQQLMAVMLLVVRALGPRGARNSIHLKWNNELGSVSRRFRSFFPQYISYHFRIYFSSQTL